MTLKYKMYDTFAPCNLSKFWFISYEQFCTVKIQGGIKPKKIFK